MEDGFSDIREISFRVPSLGFPSFRKRNENTREGREHKRSQFREEKLFSSVLECTHAPVAPKGDGLSGIQQRGKVQ